MKIKIIYEFNDGPWGGANQFLKALRKELQDEKIYTENDAEADVFIINSINAFKDLWNIYNLRRKYPQKVFIHRVDGPVFLIRGKDDYIDKGIFQINNMFADATIYQTQWSKEKCIERGMKDNKPSVTICNGCNKDIFFPKDNKDIQTKIKIIATSWSNNWNKGFKYYQYLDEHIDIKNYTFTFVGNSPVQFINGTIIPPVNSKELGDILRDSDIYITASKNDPCSNSLIEALCCQLPAVVLKDGGHPFILQGGGETFETPEEMMSAIKKVAENIQKYKENVPDYDIRVISKDYVDFAKKVVEMKKNGQIRINSYKLGTYISVAKYKIIPFIKHIIKQ